MGFEVTAYRDDEGVVLLSYEESDANSASLRARADGYDVISVRAIRRGLSPIRGHRFSLAIFAQQLQALLAAGLSVIEALDTLARRERRPDVARRYTELVRSLREGRALSHALSEAPGHFPRLFIELIRASESTGNVQDALSRYLSYHAHVDTIRRRVSGALIYPLLLMAVGILVILFLLAYVVPKFSRVYEDLGDRLPAVSHLMLQWGKLIQAHGQLVGLVSLAVVAGVAWWLSRPTSRARVIDLLTKIPTVGAQLKLYQLARFYGTVGMLLQAGIPVVSALNMAAGLLQGQLREGLNQCIQAVLEGVSLSRALESNSLSTEISSRLVVVGEKSGDLGKMLEKIAAFHDQELATWVEWFSKLFEPALMILMGLTVGGIVILMYLPIFELAESIR